MALSIREWRVIEARAHETLRAAGIVVRTEHVPWPTTYADVLTRLTSNHLLPQFPTFEHLALKVPYSPKSWRTRNVRDRVAELIAEELGPDFKVRYHRHPQAFPKDVVYIFEAANAWCEEAWNSCNVREGKQRKQHG